MFYPILEELWILNQLSDLTSSYIFVQVNDSRNSGIIITTTLARYLLSDSRIKKNNIYTSWTKLIRSPLSRIL